MYMSECEHVQEKHQTGNFTYKSQCEHVLTSLVINEEHLRPWK